MDSSAYQFKLLTSRGKKKENWGSEQGWRVRGDKMLGARLGEVEGNGWLLMAGVVTGGGLLLVLGFLTLEEEDEYKALFVFLG